MIQTASGFKLLAEHFIVERIVPVLPADCFQHGNPAPAFAFVQFERTVFIIFAKNTKTFVNLSKEYTSLKSRELEELLRFELATVLIAVVCIALLVLETLTVQRYEKYSD